MVLLIGFKTGVDLYRRQQGLTPVTSVWVQSIDKLRGWVDPKVVAIGNWYESPDCQKLYDYAIASGLKVEGARV